jgi:signal transduction histidine kinase
MGDGLMRKLLGAQLAVIAAGSAALALVALLLGPSLYHHHIHEALGYVPPTVMHHLDRAFGEALALSLGVGIAAALITAAIVSVFLSSRIVRPVHALAAAAGRVSSGDYNARVKADGGNDELAVLARSFNDMAGSLASTEQRRRRLLSDVAHELRTPLATIDAYLEGLSDGVVAPDDETWTILRHESARLNRLSEDITRVSRAEEHQLALHLEHVPPQQLIDAATSAAAPAFAAKGVQLQAAGGDAPDVAVDRDRIGEILANLLENAVRHTPAGGRVTVSARADGDDALITVADTGEGFGADEVERIFERFYRVDPSRSRDRGGSGIGLTISRALAEAQAGTLSAESEGPGRGSRFLLRLPRAATR